MKKILLSLVMLFCLTGLAYTADLGFDISNINVSADTIYLPGTGQMAIGAGYRIATVLNGMVEIRAELVGKLKDTLDSDAMAGVGAGIVLSEVIKKIGGDWILKGLNPTIGIVGLVDFTDKQTIVPAVYLTVIKAEF